MNMKKYTVGYFNNETEWNRDFDTLDEFDFFIHDVKEKKTAGILVFDNAAGQIIFWKRSMESMPIIDLITKAP